MTERQAKMLRYKVYLIERDVTPADVAFGWLQEYKEEDIARAMEQQHFHTTSRVPMNAVIYAMGAVKRNTRKYKERVYSTALTQLRGDADHKRLKKLVEDAIASE